MRTIQFEVCAETLAACVAAREGGADRIELCSGLSEGGVTPSHGLLRAAAQASGLPVHGLVRARGGGFAYSAAELAVMEDDIAQMKSLGVAGVVIGVLRPDGTVDVETMRRLVELARPLPVTFHRAFDATASLEQALEDVIATGCERVLTSGGQSDVLAGADVLARLVAQAGGRIAVAVGGGLRLSNAVEVARRTGARHFHGSLTHGSLTHGSLGRSGTVEAEAVRQMMAELRGA